MRQNLNRSTTDMIAELEERIGFEFSDHDLLVQALTHSSARETDRDYERLEFLGDRVLGLVIAEMLFRQHEAADQGELSMRLHTLVDAGACAEVADEIGLHEFIVTGSDIKTLTGRKGQNIRADVIESLIAVVFLDGGMAAAREFILRFWEPRSRQVAAARRDAKTELQEWAHRVSRAPPAYSIESREGPDHDPVFTVRVTVEGFPHGSGTGRSKREAERVAASEILYREGVWPRPGDGN